MGKRISKSAGDNNKIQNNLETAERINENISIKLAEVKKFGIDTKEIEKLIKKNQTTLKKAKRLNDFVLVVHNYVNISKMLDDLITSYNYTRELIISTVENISKSEDKGNDLTIPKKLIIDAKRLFKNKSLLEAKGKAEKASFLLNNMKQNYESASNSIENAKSMINNLKELGINTTETELLLNEALKYMKNKEYLNVIEVATKSYKIGQQLKKGHINFQKESASKKISKLKDSFADAKMIGADLNNADKLFQDILNSFENNNYNFVIEKSSSCQNAINDSMNQHKRALESINSVRDHINEAEQNGIIIVDIKNRMNELEQEVEKNNYQIVESGSKQILEEIEKAKQKKRQLRNLKEQAETNISSARSNLDDLKNRNIIVTNIEEQLVQAQNAMEEGDYDKASQYALKVKDDLKEMNKVYSNAHDHLKKAETKITDSKMLIDTSEAETLFEESKKKMSEGYYTDAFNDSSEILNLIENIISKIEPEITIKFPEISTLQSREWYKLHFDVCNEGKVHVTELKLTMSKQFETMGEMNIKDLKAGESKTLNISVKTNEIGEIPLELNLNYKNPLTNEQKEITNVKWLRIESVETEAVEMPALKIRDMPRSSEMERQVNLLSEVELFQGYVRLKVAVKNDMNTIITDTKFDLEYDRNALRLDRIEPDFKVQDNKVIFGNINPKEKRTVAFYLDPQICTESYINGNITYKDIYGKMKTELMKRRKADIVCPIFYTPDNINTAMLKRLINEELEIHDRKIFEIPEGFDYIRTSSVCKDTVQKHDLKLVREFVDYDTIDPEIETWYYGLTKVNKNKVVIKTSSRKKTNSIEMFVACDNKKVLTGFLAELGNNLKNNLNELGIKSEKIIPVTDSKIRGEILQTNTLLHHQYPDKTILSISKRGNEYEISYKALDIKSDAAELSEFIKVSPDSRADLINQIHQVVKMSNIIYCSRDDSFDEEKLEHAKPLLNKNSTPDDDKARSLNDEIIKKLPSLGKLLFSMFLPHPIQVQLTSNQEPLILKTNDNEIPWELLHDSNDFLCLKFPIGRRLRSREIPRRNPHHDDNKIRLLFIANATGDLDEAEKEVDFIVSKLSPEIEIRIIRGKEATNSEVLSAFGEGKYNIIHYAGHAEFNQSSPDESALICANNGRIYAQEIKRVLGGNPFVFLNACSSGREQMCEDGNSITGSDTEGLGSSFIFGGAMGFIGSSWPMLDISAGILASSFYDQFLNGECVGEALRKARLNLKSTRPRDINWMAFVLYGDPTMRLAEGLNI